MDFGVEAVSVRQQPFSSGTAKGPQTIAEWCPHPALEPLPLFQGQSVRLGDDGNHIDLVVDGLHELNIQGLQADCTGDTGALGQRQTSDFSTCERQKGFSVSGLTRGRVER